MKENKNINDWCETDDEDMAYFCTGEPDFVFSIAREGDIGVITLHNNEEEWRFEADELQRVGFRRMYCHDLIRRFFESNKLKQAVS